MSVYIFETDDGIGEPLKWTYELPSLQQAQIQGAQTLGELLSDDGQKIWRTGRACMAVYTAAGHAICNLEIIATLAPHLRGLVPDDGS
ncbi:hypothetical protein HNP32_001404 [Brevundimonas bullata]|uniref:DUF6894 domain-containing protein n=1 Tax=Brevundimonas bullata TaxID=13160 RepID=A0A7W7INL2_9CAUL|nr:hypothetical protein [Brevundimonas bullata]MBB4797680.1 hypothetical protein [Brevundimonas bullata]MBB6382640.1 hypothetical protein [Brevundimonas bullata]